MSAGFKIRRRKRAVVLHGYHWPATWQSWLDVWGAIGELAEMGAVQ